MATTEQRIKVNREGRVYVGAKSVGRVWQLHGYQSSSGSPMWVARNRAGVETRHLLRREAVEHLTAGWVR